MKRLLSITVIGMAALTSTCFQIRASEFVDLEAITRGTPMSDAQVSRISGDGSTVILWSWPDHPLLGYWSRADGVVPFTSAHPDFPDTTYGFEVGVSHDGAMIAGSIRSWGSEDTRAFRWTREGGIEVLPVPDGWDAARAATMSADGTILGGSSSRDGGYQRIPWTWTEESGYRFIGEGGEKGDGQPRFLDSISDNGDVLAAGSPGYRWTEETGVVDEGLGEEVVLVKDMSSDGSVMVGNYRLDDAERASPYIWSETEGRRSLGVIPEFPELDKGNATGVMAEGKVVVGYFSSYAESGEPRYDARPFVWQEAYGTRDLDQVLREEYNVTDRNEFGLGRLQDISDDGRVIAGYSTDPSDSSKDLPWVIYLNWPLGTIYGDLDLGGSLDVSDIDELQTHIRTGHFDSQSDFDFNDVVDQQDLLFWVHELKSTWLGDANLDGEFNSSDLVAIFEAGQYEDEIEGNSTWATGDWNADGEFGTADLVVAYEDGGYELGSRAAAQTVPEPVGSHLAILGLFMSLRSGLVVRLHGGRKR